MEVATASAPHESQRAHGRPGSGAAAARTELLYTEYGRTVSVLCQVLLRNRAEAEDAAQQTFLSAHRALLNGSEPREPAAWLATIARNECWARIRTRMREPLPVEELETVATTNDPLAEAIRRADLAALWHAIEALPRQQRDALLLREFGGLTYDELVVRPRGLRSCRRVTALSGPAAFARQASRGLRVALRRVVDRRARAPPRRRRRRPRRGEGGCARGRCGGPRKLRGRRALRLRQPPAGPQPAARARRRCAADQGCARSGGETRLRRRSRRGCPSRIRSGLTPRGKARRAPRRGEAHSTGGDDGDRVSTPVATPISSPAPENEQRVESIDGHSGDGSSGPDGSVTDGSSGDHGGAATAEAAAAARMAATSPLQDLRKVTRISLSGGCRAGKPHR